MHHIPSEEENLRSKIFNESVNRVWASILGGQVTPALISFKVSHPVKFDSVKFVWSKESTATENRAIREFQKLTEKDGLSSCAEESFEYWLGIPLEESVRCKFDVTKAHEIYCADEIHGEAFDEAVKLLRDTITRLEKVEPRFPPIRELYFDLAKFCYEQKLYAEHDEAFEKGLQFLEENLEARPEIYGKEYAQRLNKLAQCHLYRDALTPALGAYAQIKRALTVVPHDVAKLMIIDWHNLAKFYDLHGAEEEAKQLYKSLLEQIDTKTGPTKSQFQNLKLTASALLRFGEYEDAERAFNWLIDYATAFGMMDRSSHPCSHASPCWHWFKPYLDYLEANNRMEERHQVILQIGFKQDPDKSSDNNLVGFVDIDGNWGIPQRFERAGNFVGGESRVVLSLKESQHGRARIINKEGEIIGYDLHDETQRNDNMVPQGYKQISAISEGLIAIDSVNELKIEMPYFGCETNKKIGFADETGKLVIAPKFSFANPFERGVAIVGIGGNYGGSGCIISLQNVLYGLIDTGGNWLIEPQFKSLEYFNRYSQDERLYVYHTSTASGVITKTGDIRSVLPGCRSKFRLENEMAAVAWGEAMVGGYPERKYGYLDRDGRIAVENKFDFAFDFAGDFACVKIGGKFGYINRSGDIVIEPIYDKAEGFKNGLARVKVGGKWGYINVGAKSVVSIAYDFTNWIDSAALKITLNGKSGAVRPDGEVIFPPKFDEIERFALDQFLIKQNGLVGVIDNFGAIVIEPRFQKLHNFTCGLARAAVLRDNGELAWGFIDETGAFAVQAQYAEVYAFTEGLAAVRPLDSDLWGFVSIDGAFVIEPQFIAVAPFSQGRARVAERQIGRSNVYGIIDQRGRYVVEPKYLQVGREFHEGLCFVGFEVS